MHCVPPQGKRKVQNHPLSYCNTGILVSKEVQFVMHRSLYITNKECCLFRCTVWRMLSVAIHYMVTLLLYLH